MRANVLVELLIFILCVSVLSLAALKFFGVIHISWLVVTAPIWVPGLILAFMNCLDTKNED
jgi:hypothetical protein